MNVKARLEPLFDWLLDGAPGAQTPMNVLGRVGRELCAAGFQLGRLSAFVRTLHPRMAGRRFGWSPGEHDATVAELPWGDLTTPQFIASPLPQVFATCTEYRSLLTGPHMYAGLEEFRQAGMTDYVALPLKFMGGTVNAITLTTCAPGGFSEEQLEALRWLSRPLSRVTETLSLMRTAVTLLNTYVGRNAGERILRGQIQCGDIESIRCVIWFSDLRGFTTMSGDKTPAETISVLNELFECQVPAIDAHGGEVLKFIGDGLLAIFAITDTRDQRAAAEAAAGASLQAFAALDALNAARASRSGAPIQFGLSLHVGEVAYGNIGGANRLDFTAIGSAVNLAARLEGLTGKLGKNVLLSEPLAASLDRPTRHVGTFELKGFAQPHPVYELA
jgi:adenylate cyclase